MSTPHLPIHRLAAAGIALVLAAALPAAASARPIDSATPVRPTATPPVQPNPDERPEVSPVDPDGRSSGGGEILPFTNWVTPELTPVPKPARPVAPHRSAPAQSPSLAIPLAFAGLVALAAGAATATRRRRRTRVAA